MAGQKNAFITGANAKVKISQKTLAFCTDVSYNVTIQTIPVEAMGKFEPYSNEAVSYTVDGTMSVIRYTKNASGDGTSEDPGIPEANASGNGAPAIQAALTGNEANQSLQAHSSPGRMIEAETFDLEIYQKLREPGADGDGPDETEIVKIQDCRLTRRGMTLNKRGLYVDQYAFVGILVTDANETGTGTVWDGLSSSSPGNDLS